MQTRKACLLDGTCDEIGDEVQRFVDQTGLRSSHEVKADVVQLVVADKRLGCATDPTWRAVSG